MISRNLGTNKSTLIPIHYVGWVSRICFILILTFVNSVRELDKYMILDLLNYESWLTHILKRQNEFSNQINQFLDK